MRLDDFNVSSIKTAILTLKRVKKKKKKKKKTAYFVSLAAL